jgi:hypothetical protein
MGGSGSLDQLAPAFGRAWGDGAVIRSLVRDTIPLDNHLRFGGVARLADVKGVSFDRWVLAGSPFELPGVGGDSPIGCELSEGGVDEGAAGAVGGSFSSGRGLDIDPRTVG